MEKNYKIIAFTGGMGSGKSTVVSFISRAVVYSRVLKFAQSLYDIQEYIYDKVDLPIPTVRGMKKDRKLLQYLGTEWGRDKDANIWVNLWEKSVQEIIAKGTTSLILVDDCRFVNEAQRIKKLGGLIVKIKTSEKVREKRTDTIGSEHSSEIPLPEEYVDYTITNDGTIYDLQKQVEDLMNIFL